MRIRSLLALLAFAPLAFAHPAAAAPAIDVAQPQATSIESCLAKAKGDKLAQLQCCKSHKGVCGCRAGKIICCDGAASTEPGCTCHGDEPLIQ